MPTNSNTPSLSSAVNSASLLSLTSFVAALALLSAVAIPWSGAVADDSSGVMCGDSNGDQNVSIGDALTVVRVGRRNRWDRQSRILRDTSYRLYAAKPRPSSSLCDAAPASPA